jgi:hypothetical protein
MREKPRSWKGPLTLSLILLVCLALVALGIAAIPRWGDHSILIRLLAVLAMVGGGAVLLILGALVTLLFMIRRFFREAKRDAKGIWESIRYMLRMGR